MANPRLEVGSNKEQIGFSVIGCHTAKLFVTKISILIEYYTHSLLKFNYLKKTSTPGLKKYLSNTPIKNFIKSSCWMLNLDLKTYHTNFSEYKNQSNL